jgi:hypothetical protein
MRHVVSGVVGQHAHNTALNDQLKGLDFASWVALLLDMLQPLQ